MNLSTFKSHLRWAEGVERYAYVDTTGHVSVGVGRNLTDVGLRDSEIEFLLDNDVADVIAAARRLPYWDDLGDTRQLVVADLIFNLGEDGWKSFVKANDALERGDYERAAIEMERSRWYRQVGRRAEKLVKAMRSGVWDGG